MSKKYRGKYPKRIHTVSGSTKAGGLYVYTNEGETWVIWPCDQEGQRTMPKPGVDVTEYLTSGHYGYRYVGGPNV